MTAVSTIRISRRPRGSARSLTAASQRIDDPGKTFKSTFGGSREDWQNDAWKMLDKVGELRYYVSWRSAACSRCRFVASEIDEETGKPTGSTDQKRVNEIVRQIAGGYLGQAQLIKRMTGFLTLPGEGFIVMAVRNGMQEWYTVARSEIKNKGRTVEIDLPDGTKHLYDKNVDVLFRIWNPHPHKAVDADSPVRSTLDSLNEIVRTTQTIANASKSRLIGNGVVFVPQEMSLNTQTPPTAAAAPGEPVNPATPAQEKTVQALQDLIYQVATTAYTDQDSMAALVPIFASVPGEWAKNVSHIKFDNSVSEVAIKTRNDAIARLAMGLDVAPERLLGLGSNTNHWTAWAIGDDDVRVHVAPILETIVAAFTRELLLPVLIAEGIPNPEKYTLWFDSADLTADPDLTDEATAAFDRGAITADAYREFLGLGDSGYDLSTIEGWKELAKDKVSADVTLMQSLLPLLDLPDTIEISAPPAPVIDAAPDDEPNADEEPDTENDEPDPDKAANAVVEIMTTRALELAGKRRRTRSDHARLRTLPMHETHTAMTPVNQETADRLISGWDEILSDVTLKQLGIDPNRVRREVTNLARLSLMTGRL